MVVHNQSLTLAQAGRFRAAQDLLRTRQVAQAVVMATALVKEAPMAADAQQLLGMALADAGDHSGAEAAFRRARELAPDSSVVTLNFAGWLRKTGRLREAMAELEAVPESAQVLTRQGLVALQLHDHPRAQQAFERAVLLQPGAVTAWHGLGNALRELGDLASAEAACRKVIELSPGHAPGWYSLGVVLRLLGRIEEALAALRQAERSGHAGPELQDTVNGVLHDCGRTGEALAGARRLVATHPGYVSGYETLANLLWENGPEFAPQEDPLAVFRAAAASRPDDRELQLRLARVLLSARRPDDVLALVSALRRRHMGDPLLDWYAGEACGMLGQYEQASNLYAAAHSPLQDNPDFLNAYARHAFRAGKPDQAERCAARVVQQLDPCNPEAWSHLGTAWRMAGDPREDWLFDYENLIGYVEVAPPPGYSDMHAFLDALKSVLERLHLAGREPLDQSVRNGSQTPGRLFGRDDDTLRAAESAMRAAVDGWLLTLPRDPDHPFLSRIRQGVRIVGSWSVRLQSSGRHSNHIHNEGWMSSAFHVALPGSVLEGSAQSHAGWIQFGQPMEELGLDLAPRRLIRPRPGFLALFPSYMWHGTVPFTDPEPRLTIAFDMQPG